MIQRFERFSYAVSEIHRCWHKLAAEEMEKYGLKGAHSVYLVTMRKYPEGITASSLCELCGKDKADVSRMMSIMEAKGLVTKEGTNPKRYGGLLKLTEAGFSAAEGVCRRAAVAVEAAGAGLAQQDREVFYSALETITQNLQELSIQGLPQVK